ncbi:MAG: histidinol-phosphate transaminase [Gammaproteobacteria bacterium]|jgi:histidinol-phosphate aminotransferase
MASSVLDLARPDLASLRPYTPGSYEPGLLRLNANESPWRSPADKTERGLNTYPPPRPDALRAVLARHYGLEEETVLVTRGSSEAIDVLIRGFCVANQDAVVTTPPTFDMYRLYAGLQAAKVISVPLQRADDFAFQTEAVVAAIAEPVKIVFLCSPNNPTGNSIAERDVERVIEAAAGRAIVVIDEAYQEFASQPGFTGRRSAWPHVVVLRTLSKFVALAGARCGILTAAPEVIEFLGNVLPPYTFPTPTIEHVLAAFTQDALQISTERVQLIKRERQRLAETMRDSLLVSRVFPSDANFLLIETRSAEEFCRRAHRAGILVRQFPGQTELHNCVRVTIGRPEDNDRLIRAISGGGSND